MPAMDEVKSSLIAASAGNSTLSITPPIQEESLVSIEERTGQGSSGGNGKGKKVRQGWTKKGEGFACYLVKQIAVVGLEADEHHTHSSSSSSSSNEDGEEESSDEDKIMSVQSTRKAPPGLLHRFQEAKQQTDYGDDNCWDSSRHSNPSSRPNPLVKLPANQEPRISRFLIGGQVLPPVSEGRVLLPAPRKPVSLGNQHSEGRAIKPAPQRRAGVIARPFWRGVGVGVRGGEGSAIIIAPQTACTVGKRVT
ncbi:hypothetical protein PGT21_006615 [Puccinia graminis f. sp. tritici]|nr:hypothetical protein PGT21_006615 [Puccinia graminis f. sp. tritici]